MRGSDASWVRSNSVVYSLKHDGFEIKLTDVSISRTSGEQSVEWSDVDKRELRMYLNKHLLVEAERCLGGRRGWSSLFGSEQSSISQTDWKIKIVNSLDKVAKYLVEINEALGKKRHQYRDDR